MSSLTMGKIARYWNEREKRHHSLTEVVDRLVKKFTARIRQPKEQRANRIDVLIGESGIGKSSVLRKLPDLLAGTTGRKWSAMLWHVGTQGFEDVTGMPVISETKVGRHIQKVAKFAKADFVPGAVWRKGCTVGILDELPTAPALIQNQIREMIDGQLNGEPIDPNCLFVGTGNPPDPRFITVQALDEALEKRLKIYVVIPTADELLAVWEQRMPETIYKFLVMHRPFIDTLSPREWEGVAKDMQDVRSGGGSLAEAIEEVADELVSHQEVEIKLRKFLEFGDDPYYYPILGREFFAADERTMETYLKRIERWMDDDRRGFVGESKNDLLRTLANLTDEDVKALPVEDRTRIADNLVGVIETLSERSCSDMAKQVLMAVFSTALVAPVASRMRKSPAQQAIVDVVERFEKLREEMGSS